MYINKTLCEKCGRETIDNPPTCSCGSKSFKLIAVEVDANKTEQIDNPVVENSDTGNYPVKKKKQKWT